eukprot:g14130.t2
MKLVGPPPSLRRVARLLLWGLAAIATTLAAIACLVAARKGQFSISTRTVPGSLEPVNANFPAAPATAPLSESKDHLETHILSERENPQHQGWESDDGESFPVSLEPTVAIGYRGGYEEGFFPPVEGSTLMFMHIFKCAGSTLRHMLVDWAEENGQEGAIVRECDEIEGDDICLKAYELIDEAVQVAYISRLKVIAGHFMWGFQRHVQTPYLMVTALRNPLEVYVSGEQYMHRDETSTLPKAQQFVTESMLRVMSINGPLGLQQGQLSGFIRRIAGVPRRVWFKDGLEKGADDAVRNLETFWIVGVVEQYKGFEEVLQRSVDPEGEHEKLWKRYAEAQYNSSPIGTREVLAEIDPELIQRFNGTLALQWKVYERAVSLWDVRCRETLPIEMHEEMCTVPPPAQSYH